MDLNITNEAVTDHIRGLYTPIDSDMAEFRKEAVEAGVPVIMEETEMLINTIMIILRPHNILEIGTALGYSACFMSKALEGDVKITTIEKNYESFMKANDNVAQQKCSESIDLICDDAVHALKQLRDGGRMYDFVFIDAAKSHYRSFWDEVVKMVHRGSVILCDNVLMRGTTVIPPEEAEHKHRTNIRNMREFLEYICGLENVQTSVVAAGDGVSISYIK